MTVYDCTLFFNENDIFEIRLNEHWNFVDKFIVVEAGETHTGLKKPFNFDHERFKPYASKIEYRSFDSFDTAMSENPDLNCKNGRIAHGDHLDWARDHFQFNYTMKVLEELGATDDDLVYYSCCDEIINERAFLEVSEIFKDKEATYDLYHCITKGPGGIIGKTRPTVNFNLVFYAYKLNALRFKAEDGYQAGSIAEYATLKQILPATMRSYCLTTHPCIKDAGWHFTYADNTDGDRVHQKMQSWAHAKDERATADGRRRCDLNKNEALSHLFLEYKMSFPECVVPIKLETHPAYLVNNQEKFKDLIVTL